jgi:hypothetical protein
MICNVRLGLMALVCVWLGASGPKAFAGALDDGERGAPKSPNCIRVHSEARYSGYGYDHVVEIENGCAKAMVCTVKTDVNPEPTKVSLPAREKTTVVTFRGSPAREFKADVQCKPDP